MEDVEYLELDGFFLFHTYRRLNTEKWAGEEAAPSLKKFGNVFVIRTLVELDWNQLFSKLMQGPCRTRFWKAPAFKIQATTISGLVYLLARGHKEMSYILADQWRSRMWAQMRGGGGSGGSAN